MSDSFYCANVPGATFTQGGTFIPDSRVEVLETIEGKVLLFSFLFRNLDGFGELEKLSSCHPFNHCELSAEQHTIIHGHICI